MHKVVDCNTTEDYITVLWRHLDPGLKGCISHRLLKHAVMTLNPRYYALMSSHVFCGRTTTAECAFVNLMPSMAVMCCFAVHDAYTCN